ncbi:DUF4232 domain-containing protein [Nocardia concava]|uniref:DUF4232 domain-containing protein n=1 Tax=Nocardia concava TaxID=257281 RepID=UPI000A05EE69|nr:DUF4232 domain-containing protein [Nocardia concava]
MRRAGFATVVACAVVVVASGCGGSTSSGTATQSGGPTAATTTTADGGNSGGTTPESTAPQPNPKPTDTPIAACAPGQVDVTAQNMGAATSHYGLTLVFSIANPAQACTLTGYPGMDEITETGEVVHAERTLRGFIGGLPEGNDKEPTVVVKSGHPARAVAESVACGVLDKPDPKVAKVEVTPPNSTDTRVIDKSLTVCNLKIHPVTE